MINRRDFLGGAVCGSVATLGMGTLRGRHLSHPAPSAPPTPIQLPEHARLSFSQQGEDIILFHALHEVLKIERPTYLDVGAAYPVRGSNTYLLYTTGANGVLVEPNPVLAAQLRQERPRDTVIEAGIGVTEQAEADYYEIEGNPMLNTFSAEQVARLQRDTTERVVARVVKMRLLDVNRVIQEQWGRAPDLLSTDVEGLDEAIIRRLDLAQFRPAVICAEASLATTSGRLSNLTRYLISLAYTPRGGSMYNTVYLDTRRL